MFASTTRFGLTQALGAYESSRHAKEAHIFTFRFSNARSSDGSCTVRNAAPIPSARAENPKAM